jgi:hypothetical protein
MCHFHIIYIVVESIGEANKLNLKKQQQYKHFLPLTVNHYTL